MRREQKEGKCAVDRCISEAAAIDGEYSYNIVHADPCTGLVGLFCSGHAGGEKRIRPRVEEYVLDQPT